MSQLRIVVKRMLKVVRPVMSPGTSSLDLMFFLAKERKIFQRMAKCSYQPQTIFLIFYPQNKQN